ncbi:sugar phosphate isomerase/epimerase family protein [Orbus mooreae]|uniref:sugar phosphate isomerase/epimerase family protein n=1 Tax=Orbus mooreae TaxID=3074107 RepID=UPI00370D07F0
MKIGYNEATAMNCSTLEQDLVLCEKNGFDFIELRLDMLHDYMKTHSVEDLKQFFKHSRIKPHAFNALYTFPSLFDGSDSEQERELVKEFIWGCDIAQQIGSEYFIIVPPLQRDPNGGPFIGEWTDNFKNAVRILTHLSELAKPYGIKLCFELVGFNRSSVRTVEQAWQIIQAVNQDNVGLVLDSYNLYLYNRLNDFSVMKQIDVNKIFAVHINNGDDAPDNELSQALRRFCDQGVVDLHSYLTTLKAINYQGMVSIETFRPEYWQKPAEWVIAEAYQTTKKIMLECGVYHN